MGQNPVAFSFWDFIDGKSSHTKLASELLVIEGL